MSTSTAHDRSTHDRPTGRTRRAWPSVLVVLVAAGLLATVPGAPQADVPAAAATEEPVSQTVLACPPGRADASLRTAAATRLPATGPGAVELAVAQAGEPTRTLTFERGELASTPVRPEVALVRGDGPSARGVLALREERAGGTSAGAGCTAPRPSWWFAGAGAGVDHSSILFLTNADDGPAVVDVRLHGATGSVDEAGTRGLTLAPGQTLRLPLVEVAPGSDELTVEVGSTRGRVSAHLLDTVRTPDGEGREWLPPVAVPAEEVVLPGVAEDADRVRLLVTNPGEEQAIVDLQLLTTDGAVVPLGTEQLSVDPGTVERLDLTEELEGRAAGVRLVAEVPVTAAARTTLGADVGYAGSAEALTGPAGIVLVGDRSEVQVAAGDDPVSLRLLMHDAQGREVLRRPVAVPPSGLVRVPAPAEAAYALLLPRSGGGYAAAVHTRPGLSARPATPLPTTVLRAVVLPWTGEDDG